VAELSVAPAPAELALPFEGLPTTWVIVFSVAFVVLLCTFAWTAVLFVRGQRYAPPDPAATGEFTWVFLVPALNEEVTIADSVARLDALDIEKRHIVVIDDGSDDGTPEVLGRLDVRGLEVLRRNPPHARQGKAAALNNAYREIAGVIGNTPRERVIVCVVDADGRLDAAAPAFAAGQFSDPQVGGIQSLVRIYNKDRLLTYMQDVEFSIYGYLYQAGRSDWGTAGMGGNGQFNRLRALDDVADHEGPWRDRLTEDQDLGLRLLIAGWHGRQELRSIVSQQGLGDLRRLYRQRTRWSQGNLQAIGLISELWRSQLPFAPRLEQSAYLLLPFAQGLIGFTLVAAVALAVFGSVPFWGDGAWWQVLFFYFLAFGGTMMGCIARGKPEGWPGMLKGYLLAHVYAFYSWLLWPVLVRSALRQLTERRDWAKTEREPIAAGEDPGSEG
jgi:1,2-diacylglycerol 3-beta-glucosyltransferase